MESPSGPILSKPTENVICPACEEEIEVDLSPGQTFRCPYCNAPFYMEGDEPITLDEDDPERVELERRKAEELDGLRIRQLAQLRRSEYRQRSYAVTGLAACWIGVGQAVWMASVHVTERGWEPKLFGYLVFGLFAIGLGVWLTKVAKRLSTGIAEHPPTLPDPSREPDFAPLNDGHDRWEKLNDVR